MYIVSFEYFLSDLYMKTTSIFIVYGVPHVCLFECLLKSVCLNNIKTFLKDDKQHSEQS